MSTTHHDSSAHLITDDVLCPRCDYNLRGLTGESVACPECGEHVNPAELREMRERLADVGASGITHLESAAVWVIVAAPLSLIVCGIIWTMTSGAWQYGLLIAVWPITFGPWIGFTWQSWRRVPHLWGLPVVLMGQLLIHLLIGGGLGAILLFKLMISATMAADFLSVAGYGAGLILTILSLLLVKRGYNRIEQCFECEQVSREAFKGRADLPKGH